MANIQQALIALKQGEIIAYPTEAVFGLGCDPYNIDAVQRLLALKHRDAHKGLILIAASWQQLQPLLQPLTTAQYETVMATWPGPVTWVIPAAANISPFIRGRYSSLAVRITAHPLAHALCQAFDKPIISTSANHTGYPPCTTYEATQQAFANDISCILEGKVGDLKQPTQIRDLLTQEILR